MGILKRKKRRNRYLDLDIENMSTEEFEYWKGRVLVYSGFSGICGIVGIVLAIMVALNVKW